jgi:hypothetical protein
LATSLLAGCGTSEYERRMNSLGLAAAQRGATSASFDEKLFAAAPIDPNQPPTIRVPQLLTYPFVTGTVDADFANAPVAATELQPPKIQLPALKATWRGYGKNALGVSLPIYLYLSQQPAGTTPSLMDSVSSQVNAAYPGKVTPWEDISFIAQDGVTSVPWKRLTVTADMPYGVPPGAEIATAPTKLHFYVHNSNGWEVLAGFRISEELDNDLKYTVETAAMVGGTLKTTP